MVHLSKLPESILVQIVSHLTLQELQQLAQTCGPIRKLVYDNACVWHQHDLFPPSDSRISDRFIRHFVPNITRHHGIRTIWLERLPLSWLGYFFIFDQFAHSVDHIHVETSYAILQDLIHHLTVFAANLTVLQQDNQIPITFRQYGLDASFYYQILVDQQFLGQPSLAHITQSINNRNTCTSTSTSISTSTSTNTNTHSSSSSNYIRKDGGGDGPRPSNLDDPPFENLQHWTVICTDHSQPDHSQQAQQKDSVVRNCLSQLESLISFLAGRQVTAPGTNITQTTTTTSPVTAMTAIAQHITGYKRTQDHLDTSSRQKQKLVSSASHTSSLYV